MRPAVKVVANEILAKDWGTLSRYTIDYTRRDGRVQRHHREVYDHGMAAAVLLHCPDRDVVTLVRQFRLPPFLDGRDGFLLEVCAGLLDGDTPEACARREAEEEAGIRIGELRHAFDTIVSPGSLTETISCFVGTYTADAAISPGGGLEAEGEDIEIVELPVAEALAMIADGRIIDAKTIMLLQHLALGQQNI
jgi:nudix-type nucleoside diphosphatase (YffH/AdpP family)